MITYHTQTRMEIKLKGGSVIPVDSEVTVNFDVQGNPGLCQVTVHLPEFEGRMIKLNSGRSTSYFKDVNNWKVPGVFLGVHPSLTITKIQKAAESQMFGLENPGFCISCGNEQDGCEPDAREYECERCGERKVYGAEELLVMVE